MINSMMQKVIDKFGRKHWLNQKYISEIKEEFIGGNDSDLVLVLTVCMTNGNQIMLSTSDYTVKYGNIIKLKNKSKSAVTYSYWV